MTVTLAVIGSLGALILLSVAIARAHRPHVPDDALDRAALKRLLERYDKDPLE